MFMEGDHALIKIRQGHGYAIFLMNKGDELMFHLNYPLDYYPRITLKEDTIIGLTRISLTVKRDYTKVESCAEIEKKNQKGK